MKGFRIVFCFICTFIIGGLWSQNGPINIYIIGSPLISEKIILYTPDSVYYIKFEKLSKNDEMLNIFVTTVFIPDTLIKNSNLDSSYIERHFPIDLVIKRPGVGFLAGIQYFEYRSCENNNLFIYRDFRVKKKYGYSYYWSDENKYVYIHDFTKRKLTKAKSYPNTEQYRHLKW